MPRSRRLSRRWWQIPLRRKSEYEGWTSFNQKVEGKYIICSFTPEDHPVHPTAVRREIVNKDGEVLISMVVMCHSSRFDCDQLIEQFQQINENLRRKLTDAGGSLFILALFLLSAWFDRPMSATAFIVCGIGFIF
jgi:hypothetical protein